MSATQLRPTLTSPCAKAGRPGSGARPLGAPVRGPVRAARAGPPQLVRLRPFLLRPAFPAVCDAPGAQPACPPARHRLQHRQVGRSMCLKRLPAWRSACATCRCSWTWPARTCRAGRLARSRHASTPSTCWIGAQALPQGYELVWMSQLLDCFSEDQIVADPGQGARGHAASGPTVDPRAVLGPPALRSRCLQPAADLAVFRLRCQWQQPDVRLEGVSGAVAARRIRSHRRSIDGIGGYHTLLECRVTGAPHGHASNRLRGAARQASTVHPSPHRSHQCSGIAAYSTVHAAGPTALRARGRRF